MTIDFESLYSEMTNELSDNQKRINIPSALNVFYGLSKDGFYLLKLFPIL